MARGEELTDEQRAVIEPHPPGLPTRDDGRGRPWRESREVMDGILWILHSGARWKDLPGRFPPYQTCHRRFQRWVGDGSLLRVLEALVCCDAIYEALLQELLLSYSPLANSFNPLPE